MFGKNYVIILFFAIMFFSGFTVNDANASERMKRPGTPWGCPPEDPELAPPPTFNKDKGDEPAGHEGKLDRLYMYAVDNHGNDFQTWCLDHGKDGDYAYYSSAPGRKDFWVAGCKLICGFNFASWTVSDGTILENKTISSQNKTFIFHVNGTLEGFFHNNIVPGDWKPSTSPDKGKDHHFIFNWTSNEWIHHTTTNESFSKPVIKGTEKKILSLLPDDTNQGIRYAEDLLRESIPGIVGNVGGGKEMGQLPLEHELVYREVFVSLTNEESRTFHLAHPAAVQIDEIIFDRESKSLNLVLPSVTHSDYVNISIPRELLDHEDGEKFVVLVDNKQTDHTEFSTSTYRTMTLDVDENSRIVVITGTKVIPEFGLSILILIVGFVSIVALSLKTKLKVHTG